MDTLIFARPRAERTKDVTGKGRPISPPALPENEIRPDPRSNWRLPPADEFERSCWTGHLSYRPEILDSHWRPGVKVDAVYITEKYRANSVHRIEFDK